MKAAILVRIQVPEPEKGLGNGSSPLIPGESRRGAEAPLRSESQTSAFNPGPGARELRHAVGVLLQYPDHEHKKKIVDHRDDMSHIVF
ncbi:MAG: hypothetical protein HW383_432 [Candidatus Magasanikbacteria bacterium]|nr:hypothetical protein [Candidatus Magasanikbacteria bacterium]